MHGHAQWELLVCPWAMYFNICEPSFLLYKMGINTGFVVRLLGGLNESVHGKALGRMCRYSV